MRPWKESFAVILTVMSGISSAWMVSSPLAKAVGFCPSCQAQAAAQMQAAASPAMAGIAAQNNLTGVLNRIQPEGGSLLNVSQAYDQLQTRMGTGLGNWPVWDGTGPLPNSLLSPNNMFSDFNPQFVVNCITSPYVWCSRAPQLDQQMGLTLTNVYNAQENGFGSPAAQDAQAQGQGRARGLVRPAPVGPASQAI